MTTRGKVMPDEAERERRRHSTKVRPHALARLVVASVAFAACGNERNGVGGGAADAGSDAGKPAALDSGTGSDAQSVPPPESIDPLFRLSTIAELRPPGYKVELISSYDRTGDNADLGIGPDTSGLLTRLNLEPTEFDHSYLYEDEGRYVIFDSEGPGVVSRIWMTGLDALFQDGLGGDVAFEFDDEATPRLVANRTELFSGQRAPFVAPLAGDDAVSSGGFFSVLPMRFARRLRISTSVVPNWVQITHARLPLDAEIESFDPAIDASAEAATFKASGLDPKGIEPEIDTEREVSLAPRETASVWEHAGPGTVLRFEVIAPKPRDEIPLGIRLVARFDGATEPQVDAPLDEIFAASLGRGGKSLAFGSDGARHYLFFPMPFASSAQLSLRNDGDLPFAGWSVRVGAIARRLGQNPGYFHAAARSARLEPDGRDYVMLDRRGTGHVVGVVMTAGCGRVGACRIPFSPGVDGGHLEGDERITIDGSLSPPIHGTGLEDFFGGGFYFSRGTFTLPTHGNPGREDVTSSRRPGINLRSMYRLLLADAIPFRSDIRLAVEHGPTNDVPAEMSSVVFYYAVPDPSLGESDRIALGDTASEAAHELVAEDRADRTLTSAPRGDDSDAPITVSGIEATVTRFRVAVLEQNRGVRLSRLADIAGGRQSAVVSVDGVVVGSWSSAERNATLRFAELALDVPASFTAGKRSLAVEIDARGSPNPWTAYGYEVWSHLAP